MFSSGAVSDDRFTIYSQLGQRSQTWVNLRSDKERNQSRPSGPTILTLPLPNSANQRSIVVTQKDHGMSGLPMVPSYRLGGDRSASGQRLRQEGVVEVTKGEERYRGLLLDIGPNSVVIFGVSSGDGGNRQPYIIRVVGYDTIMPTLNDLSDSNNTQGDILQVFSSTTEPLTITYLLDGLQWTAHHTIVIDTQSMVGQSGIDNPVVLWRIGGAIQNTTEIPFTTTKLRLVAGSVNQPRHHKIHSNQRKAMMMAESTALGSQSDSLDVDVIPVDDYVAYDLPDQPLVLGSHSTTDVEIRTLTGFSTRKIYKIALEAGIDDGLQRSEVVYRLRAPDFIPAGQAIVYQYDPEVGTIGSLLGAVNIRESQRDQEVDLAIGHSSLVTTNVTINRSTERTEENENDDRRRDSEQNAQVTTAINAEITNRTDLPSIVLLSYNVGDRLVGVTGTPHEGVFEPTQRGDRLEWVVIVAPRGTLSFDALVTTSKLAPELAIL